MKKLIFTIASLLIVALVFAQSPQSFKYQAVVRDGGGEILANQTVGLQVSILEGSETGTAVYVEEWNIETNDYGLININIGEGTTADDFSAISWGTANYYVQIALDETGGISYTVMGASQLLSVPYALYSNETGNIIPSPWITDDNGINYSNGNIGIGSNSTVSKFQIDGTGVTAETPLFEVRNNAGEVVFAVYNEGIRMNVDNASNSHDRGGFAIGGQNQNKGLLDYFQVTPDSVRIYLDESAKPSDRGGFAIGGQNQNKAITGEYMFINTDSARITTSSEGGFGVQRKGTTKEQGANYLNITPENMFIGHQSGDSTTAEGVNNTFLGYQTGISNTDGDNNVFLGFKSGYSNIGGGDNVFIGNSTGFDNRSGTQNVFIGYATGISNTTSSQNVFMGYKTGYSNEDGNYNLFLGSETGYKNISGNNNLFLGINTGFNNTTGDNNVLLGRYAGYSNSIGDSSVMIGNKSGYYETSGNRLYIENSKANAENALIYGEFDNDSLRFNANVNVDGNMYATTYIGDGSQLTGIAGVTGGVSNPGNTSIVADNDDNGDGVVVLQTGTTAKLTVINNGNVGIATTTPAYKLDVNGDLNFTGSLLKNGAPYTGGSGYWEYDSDNIYNSNLENVGIGTGAVVNAKLHVKGSGSSDATTSLKLINSNNAELFNVLDNGNVGIGNSAPQTLLHVLGENTNDTPQEFIRIDRASGVSGAVAAGISLTNNTSDPNTQARMIFTLSSDSDVPNVNVMSLTGLGNVGIGKLNPSKKLHVLQTANDGSDGIMTEAASPGGSVTLYHAGNGTARIRVHETDVVTMENNGNVGIGTISPIAKLDINAGRTGTHPATINGLYVTGNFDEASNGVEFRHFNGTQGVGIGYNSIYATGGSENQNLNIIPKGTGNVGIGTTSPHHLLDLGSSFGAKLALYQNAGVNDFYGFGMSDYTMEIHAGSTAGSTAEAKMVIKNNGNIGIGTTTPETKLVIKDGSSMYVHIGADVPGIAGDAPTVAFSRYTGVSGYNSHYYYQT